MATKSKEVRRNGRVKKKEPKKDIMGGALGKSVKAPTVGRLPSKLLNMQFMRDNARKRDQSVQEQEKQDILDSSKWAGKAKVKAASISDQHIRPMVGLAEIFESEEDSEDEPEEPNGTVKGRKSFGGFGKKVVKSKSPESSDSEEEDENSDVDEKEADIFLTNIETDIKNKSKNDKVKTSKVKSKKPKDKR